MKKSRLALLLGFLFACALAFTSGVDAWQTTLRDFPGTSTRAEAVVVDAAGDVISTGRINRYAVVKMSGATGEVKWRYSPHPPDASFSPSDIAIDSNGDVFVTVVGQRFVTKISGIYGTEIWTRLIGGTGGPSPSVINDVKVDRNGDVVTAGWLGGLFNVCKLDGRSGDEMWHYEREGYAMAVAVDPFGDVAASGIMNKNFGVVKLHGASGLEAWQREINGAGNFSDVFEEANSVIMDSDGSVVAAGATSNHFGNPTDFTVAKYSANGDEQWALRIDGRRHSDDKAESVTLDGNGNVIAAGFMKDEGDEHFHVIKFSADGNIGWSTAAEVPIFQAPYVRGRAHTVSVDGAGDVVAAGMHNERFTVVKFVGSGNRAGQREWLRQPGLPPTPGNHSEAVEVVIDADNNVVAAGETLAPDQFSMYTVVKLRGTDGADFDITAPVLTVPSTITVTASSTAGAVVTYSVSATDNLDSNPVVSCAPQSGSVFPIGSTSVNCTATDASNNSASDSFRITVLDATPTTNPCTPPEPVPLSLFPAPTRGLAKAISMGQSHKINEYGHLLYEPNAEVIQHNAGAQQEIVLVKDTGSTWVRLWADWPFYQPSDLSRDCPLFTNIVDLEHPCLPDGTKNPNYIEHDCRTKNLIENLDKQVESARDKGLGIILTTKGYPRWANANKDYYVVPNLKDLGENGPWGNWIKFLVKRYGLSQSTKNMGLNGRGRYVDFLELTNEPNLQMQPQRGMPEKVARMFKTAQTIVKNYGTTLRLAGPATADVDHAGCQRDRDVTGKATTTNYVEFTEELLNQLRRIGFVADENFAWTHHNYRDVECDKNVILRGKLSKEEREITNSAAWVRWMIVSGNSRYKWEGWPDKRNPRILITEGGARLDGLIEKYFESKDSKNFQELIAKLKEKQRDLVRLNYLRMAGLKDDRRLGEGIAMVTSYLTYTDPASDSGLLDFIGLCGKPKGYTGTAFIWTDRAKKMCTGQWGQKRLVYDTWKSLPSSP